MKDKERLTLQRFLVLSNVMENAGEIMGRLQEQPCPQQLCGKDVPQNLSLLSYGTLDDLQSIGPEGDSVFRIIEILTGVKAEELLDEDVNKVFGFLNMVKSEIEKINKLFSSIKVSYSQDEVSAGVRELQFGTFGILDWYAKRMHIADHNEVRDIAWVRIYQCMKNDNEVSEYERRLYKLQESKIKKK